MVSVRTAKAKGSSFEYDCQHSLQNWTNRPVYRTAERGFQMQYDLKIETGKYSYIAIECKRHAEFSWNKLLKTYEKLEKVTPDADLRYLLFKPNRQPCLIFFKEPGGYIIKTFEEYFRVPFEKHPSTRVTKK